ncbi:MAG: hypothetical protein D6771_08335, partial [Zetaproteobacteria bacterium]
MLRLTRRGVHHAEVRSEEATLGGDLDRGEAVGIAQAAPAAARGAMWREIMDALRLYDAIRAGRSLLELLT